MDFGVLETYYDPSLKLYLEVVRDTRDALFFWTASVYSGNQRSTP